MSAPLRIAALALLAAALVFALTRRDLTVPPASPPPQHLHLRIRIDGVRGRCLLLELGATLSGHRV